MTNEHSVVDPSILFGGNANPNDGKSDADLQSQVDAIRAAHAARAARAAGEDTGAIPDFLKVEETVQPETPVFTTRVDEAGQTEVVVAPGEGVPVHAPIGHNQPDEEEAPLSREDMLKDMWRDISAA